MFMNDMKEKNENQAIIQDIKRFLRFVYLGKFDWIKSMAKQLLHVSDMFDVMDLKQICEHFFWNYNWKCVSNTIHCRQI